MAKIVAKRPILLANRIYQPGELLPAWDAAVTAAWLEAGSAVLVSDETDKTETNKDAAPEGESPAGGNSTAENGDGETSDAGNSEETPDTAATPGDGKGKSTKGKSRKK